MTPEAKPDSAYLRAAAHLALMLQRQGHVLDPSLLERLPPLERFDLLDSSPVAPVAPSLNGYQVDDGEDEEDRTDEARQQYPWFAIPEAVQPYLDRDRVIDLLDGLLLDDADGGEGVTKKQVVQRLTTLFQRDRITFSNEAIATIIATLVVWWEAAGVIGPPDDPLLDGRGGTEWRRPRKVLGEDRTVDALVQRLVASDSPSQPSVHVPTSEHQVTNGQEEPSPATDGATVDEVERAAPPAPQGAEGMDEPSDPPTPVQEPTITAAAAAAPTVDEDERSAPPVPEAQDEGSSSDEQTTGGNQDVVPDPVQPGDAHPTPDPQPLEVPPSVAAAPTEDEGEGVAPPVPQGAEEMDAPSDDPTGIGASPDEAGNAAVVPSGGGSEAEIRPPTPDPRLLETPATAAPTVDEGERAEEPQTATIQGLSVPDTVGLSPQQVRSLLEKMVEGTYQPKYRGTTGKVMRSYLSHLDILDQAAYPPLLAALAAWFEARGVVTPPDNPDAEDAPWRRPRRLCSTDLEVLMARLREDKEAI